MGAKRSTATEISETELRRAGLVETARRVTLGRSRVVVTRRGKPVYALVPVSDLQRLEALDDDPPDLIARQFARAAKLDAEAEARGDRNIPAADVRKALGL